MPHPKDTLYPILRTTSNDDGTPIQTILDLIPGKPYGIQNALSQDGLAINIDDGSGQDNWGLYVSQEPRLNEFKFTPQDKPSYLPINSHKLSFAETSIIVRTGGAMGSAYSAPREGGN